jgi:hypothetical protein
MPRFYFHLFNDMDVRDEEGVELPNDAAALQRAAFSAREMAAQSVREGRLVLDHRIEVANDHGDTIGTVHFGDVVEIITGEAANEPFAVPDLTLNRQAKAGAG